MSKRALFLGSQRFASAVAAALALGTACRAEFTFLPLTPYLSAADSPFPLTTNPTFHLEDFENNPGCIPGPGVFCGGGMFDAPGVKLIHGSTGQGASVDADDGIIDGSGAGGASGDSTPVFANPDLTFVFSAFELEFDATQLGFFPTAVGFVLTDGAGPMSSLTVYDSLGNSEVLVTNSLILDPNSAIDDRFIGVLNPLGITRLRMAKTIITSTGDFNSPRIDHFQYGLLVPEPTTLALWCMAGVFVGVRGVSIRL